MLPLFLICCTIVIKRVRLVFTGNSAIENLFISIIICLTGWLAVCLCFMVSVGNLGRFYIGMPAVTAFCHPAYGIMSK